MTGPADQVLPYVRRHLPMAADKAVRRVARTLASQLIMLTPVDTGRARGNWKATTAGIATGGGYGSSDFSREITPEQEGRRDRQGFATMRRVREELQQARAGDTVTIYNPIFYTEFLERGHSPQAPAGMVRVVQATWVTFAGVEVRRAFEHPLAGEWEG